MAFTNTSSAAQGEWLQESETHTTKLKEKENVEDNAHFEMSADPSKYVTLPILYDELWRKYQTTLDWFWTPHDVYISSDKESMEKTFSLAEQDYILSLLSLLFTTHSCVINKELFMAFMNQVEIKEASYFFGSQADTKKTHSRMLSLLLDELLSNDMDKKNRLISQTASVVTVRHLITLSIQGTSSKSKSFAQRLFAFAAIQGIVFPSLVIVLKWLLKRNNHNDDNNKQSNNYLDTPSVMPGLKQANEFIWRDEELHFSFSTLLFRYIDSKISVQDAHSVTRAFVAATKAILINSYPTTIVGMHAELIDQFVENQADNLLKQLEFDKLYNKENPFDWLEKVRDESNNHRIDSNKPNTANILDFSQDFGEAKFDIGVEF